MLVNSQTLFQVLDHQRARSAFPDPSAKTLWCTLITYNIKDRSCSSLFRPDTKGAKTPTGSREVLGDEDGDERGCGGLAVGGADPVAQFEGVAENSLCALVAACGQAAQVVVPQRPQQEAALRRTRHQRPHRPHPARVHLTPQQMSSQCPPLGACSNAGEDIKSARTGCSCYQLRGQCHQRQSSHADALLEVLMSGQSLRISNAELRVQMTLCHAHIS
jgi:hypothetical protein